MATDNLVPRDWSIETNVEVVKNAVSSYKAWRTKKHDVLRTLITQHTQIKSHYKSISVQGAFLAYQHKQFKAKGRYAWLSENDEPNKDTYELRLNELTEEYSRAATEYYACLAAAGGATNNEDTPGQGGANKTKVKPKELKRDFTPMERTTWMRLFRHFFRASNMEKSPAQEQQANWLVSLKLPSQQK